MKTELKPCPFCGNDELCIDVVAKRADLFTEYTHCVIEIMCNCCELVKTYRILGSSEKDCVKEAIRLWGLRENISVKKFANALRQEMELLGYDEEDFCVKAISVVEKQMLEVKEE